MFRVIPMHMCRKNLIRFTISHPTIKSSIASAHTVAPTAGHGHHVEPHYSRIEHYPRIGNREVVGYGRNGEPSYHDEPDCPCPAVRWTVDTEEIKKLREKAKGDWSQLTIAEKKALYRADFRSTISETLAPTGEWKFTFGLLFTLIGTSIWLYYAFSSAIYSQPRLETSSNEHQYRMLESMIQMGVGRVHGIARDWDYEKGDWKKNTKN